MWTSLNDCCIDITQYKSKEVNTISGTVSKGKMFPGFWINYCVLKCHSLKRYSGYKTLRWAYSLTGSIVCMTSIPLNLSKTRKCFQTLFEPE